MENNKNFSDKNQDINKEQKYMAEIFELLKRTVDNPNSEETLFIKDLFIKEAIGETELLNRVKSIQ